MRAYFQTKVNQARHERNVKNTKRESIYLGTVTATITARKVFSSPYRKKIVGVSFECTTGRTVDGTDFITQELVNIGLAGAGTTKIVDATDTGNTTFTGGTAIVANVALPLVISTTAADLVVLANEMLAYTLTVAATISIANCILHIDYEDDIQ